MKKLFTILLFATIFSQVYSQTEVSGVQTGIWTAENTPYLVIGDITIPSGGSLIIEPGVEVNFQGLFKFIVNGNVQAIGTETDSIQFTTDNTNLGWGGIRLNSSQNGSHFAYCLVENGKTSGSDYPNQHGGGFMLDNSNAVIEHCTLKHNEATADDNGMGGAIYAINTSSQTEIKDCLFTNNHSYGEGGAIKLTGDNGLLISNCEFYDNTVLYGGGAICLYGCYDTKIDHSLFIGNQTNYSSGGALYIEGYCTRVVITNSTLYDNQALGGDGGAADVVFSEASFTNSIIYNNNGYYSNNIYLDFGYAEINYCNTPMPDGATGSHNINTNPLFVDASNHDYNLQETSPCIDAGIDFLTITTAYNEVITVVDMDPSEYIGVAPDIGAYEFDPNLLIQNKENEIFTIFPNPTSDLVHFQFEDNQIREIRIFDLSGKLISEKVINNMKADITVSSLDKGCYMIQLKDNKGIFTKKLIKQ